MHGIRYYQVYGLAVQSALELPELFEIAACQPDVTVGVGEAKLEPGPVTYSGFDFQTTANSFLLEVDGIGKYSVADGSRITVQPHKSDFFADGSASAADIRLFLLGSCFGALLHQRGDLPIHMSAISAPSGVWGFTGPSGAGKSTLAGWLHGNYGWPLVSDDVAAIRFESGVPIAYPGPRRLKLWENSMEMVSLKCSRVVQDLSNTPKYQLYLDSVQEFSRAPLLNLVWLHSGEKGQEPALRRLTGAAAFDACIKAIYRPIFAKLFRQQKQFFKDIVMFQEKISVFNYSRSWDLDIFGESAVPLVEEMAEWKQLPVSGSAKGS